jgi:hypothetical protein
VAHAEAFAAVVRVLGAGDVAQDGHTDIYDGLRETHGAGRGVKHVVGAEFAQKFEQ